MATEKRLIDANAYVDELKWLQEQVSSASAIEIQEYIDRTNRQPTVDAVEVKHGRWEEIEASDELYQCSACGEWQFIPEEHFAYCPYCGAKMDGNANAQKDD